MTLALPEPIAAYFAADAEDHTAVALCFTPGAVVIDEQRSHAGRDAIARWKAGASTKYDYVSEPIGMVREGERFIVTAHVTGNFPGSPVDLRYDFTLNGDAITRLQIAP